MPIFNGDIWKCWMSLLKKKALSMEICKVEKDFFNVKKNYQNGFVKLFSSGNLILFSRMRCDASSSGSARLIYFDFDKLYFCT